jgi:hypothetical protein
MWAEEPVSPLAIAEIASAFAFAALANASTAARVCSLAALVLVIVQFVIELCTGGGGAATGFFEVAILLFPMIKRQQKSRRQN